MFAAGVKAVLFFSAVQDGVERSFGEFVHPFDGEIRSLDKRLQSEIRSPPQPTGDGIQGLGQSPQQGKIAGEMVYDDDLTPGFADSLSFGNHAYGIGHYGDDMKGHDIVEAVVGKIKVQGVHLDHG